MNIAYVGSQSVIRANLSFVLMYVMTDAYSSLRFSAIFLPVFCLLCCILVLSLRLLWRQGVWMKTSLYVNHSLVVFILLFFMLLVDLC